jgi:hypothetical protein
MSKCYAKCIFFAITSEITNDKRMLASLSPLQSGTIRTYPPLEGAGGGFKSGKLILVIISLFEDIYMTTHHSQSKHSN